jgi:hypothetical protein
MVAPILGIGPQIKRELKGDNNQPQVVALTRNCPNRDIVCLLVKRKFP